MRFDVGARTTMAFIAMPDENTSEFVFYRNPGADMMLRPDELDERLIAGARAFHFGSISLISEPSRSATLRAIEIARRSDVLVSFDVNYRPALWGSRSEAIARIQSVLPQVHVVKVNEAELELLTGSPDLGAAGRLLERGPALCVVTLGSDGSYYHTEQGSGYVAAFRVATVDATGCGDAFVAGLLRGLLNGDWQRSFRVAKIRRILRYANAVGALTSLTLGAIPALPTSAQVDGFLAEMGEADQA